MDSAWLTAIGEAEAELGKTQERCCRREFRLIAATVHGLADHRAAEVTYQRAKDEQSVDSYLRTAIIAQATLLTALTHRARTAPILRALNIEVPS